VAVIDARKVVYPQRMQRTQPHTAEKSRAGFGRIPGIIGCCYVVMCLCNPRPCIIRLDRYTRILRRSLPQSRKSSVNIGAEARSYELLRHFHYADVEAMYTLLQLQPRPVTQHDCKNYRADHCKQGQLFLERSCHTVSSRISCRSRPLRDA
jgi:hypothetical protein